MKVKIGDNLYDSKKQPIMIMLEKYNKEHISNMSDEATKYCEYPDSMSDEEIKEFMIVKEKIDE